MFTNNPGTCFGVLYFNGKIFVQLSVPWIILSTNVKRYIIVKWLLKKIWKEKSKRYYSIKSVSWHFL
jgi:hypothetical protein